MTKPVQEPSVRRSLSNQEWGILQLQRRPAPQGHQLPAFRAVMIGPVSIPNFSETPIDFTDWENEDSSIFQEATSGGFLTRVSFLLQGVYSITVTAFWDDTSMDAYRGLLLLDTSLTSANWDPGTAPNMGSYASRYDSEQFTYPQTFTVVRKYPLFGVTPGDVSPAGIYGRVTAKVMQLSGIAQDLQTYSLDIFYLGPSMTSI